MPNLSIARAVLANQKDDKGNVKYPNVRIEEVDSFGKERCQYDGPDNTVCYIQNQKHGVIEKVMAAHEVSHFLNYEEKVTDNKKVRLTQTWPIWVIVMVIIAALTLLLLIQSTAKDISMYIVFPFAILSCALNYKAWSIVIEKMSIHADDEQKTQDRAVRELLAVNDFLELNLDREEVEKVAQEHIDRYVYNINSVLKFIVALIGVFTIAINIMTLLNIFI